MPANEVVEKFIQEMVSWEKTYESATKSTEYKTSIQHQVEVDRIYKEKLNEIFNSYLTDKAKLKQGGRLFGLFSSRPPMYEQQIEKQIESGKKYVIYAKQLSGFSAEFMYEVVDNKIDSISSVFDPSSRKFKKLESI